MVETTIAIPALLPGQEYLAQLTDLGGKTKYVYAYRSQYGEFFSCTGSSEEEVRDRCMNWLSRKEKPYHR